MNIKNNVTLKPYSTFKIGGVVEYFCEVMSTDDLVEALRFAAERDLKVGIIGAGCNLVIRDEPIDGLVIKMSNRHMKVENSLVTVDSGVSFSAFVAKSHSEGLVGLEWMPSVPSSIGGGIRGNAGAFGGETKDRLKSVRVYRSGEILDLEASGLEFRYRYSTFKDPVNTDIILAGTFELVRGDVIKAREEVRGYVLRKQSNQPVGVACSGCIFQNYTGIIQDESLRARFPELEKFNEQQLIPSGYLIEKSGLKGLRIGGAMVSQKHANYIINPKEQATFQDVITLIQEVKVRVFESFGVKIQEEVVYLHDQMKSR